MSIGENLKKFRSEKKISQRKLAQAAGVSFAYIQQLEKNEKTNPGIEIINKLSIALGIEVSDLIGIDLEKECGENIGKLKTDMISVAKMAELNNKKTAGTLTKEDFDTLQSFSKDDWGNFILYGLSGDDLPADMVSYMQFIKLIETLGYKTENFKIIANKKINTISLFKKIKYQIDLEVNFSKEDEQL